MRRTRRRTGRTKVVHVSSAHPWSDNRVHLREAAGLAAAGFDVTLIAVERDVDVPGTGVRVQTIPKYGRIKRITWGSIRAISKAVHLRPDVVHMHDPELLWAVPLLRLLRISVVFDAHEDLPDQVMGKHYLGERLRRLLVPIAHFLVWIAGRSTMVVAATDQIATRFPRGKTIVVRNFPRLLEAEKDLPPPSERNRQVAYVGALSRNRGALVMIDALDDLRFPAGWQLELAGHATPPDLITELERRPGWQRVRYVGSVSPMRAREISATSRVGFVLFDRSDAHIHALPTKMFEYLASGTPVVVSDFPMWRDIVERHQCGLLVDETSPSAVASAIDKYADDHTLLDMHGRNARNAAVNELNWEHEEATLLRGYRSILDAGDKV